MIRNLKTISCSLFRSYTIENNVNSNFEKSEKMESFFHQAGVIPRVTGSHTQTIVPIIKNEMLKEDLQGAVIKEIEIFQMQMIERK
ncbi:hypothetical protein [Priestia megaterium]|uniref:hypothetical protein n=2 Tax=Priestia megaterium TaxID=1404 RepID=UPI001BEB2290|nr:hypothetical protein [Priestia megaterium]MBT2281040.1 hypothetical protein [Priestia megaterium]